MASLARWGLLDRVVASNCPPMEHITFDVGPFALVGSAPAVDGADVGYAPTAADHAVVFHDPRVAKRRQDGVVERARARQVGALDGEVVEHARERTAGEGPWRGG